MMIKITSCLSEAADPFCHALAGYLTDQLGREVAFVDDIPCPERLAQLRDGELDAGWICGVDYVGKTRKPAYELLAAPVMQGQRYRGKPLYFSDVIVRKNSSYKTFEDLRGKRWVYNEPGSFSGYLVVLHRLGQMGEGVNFFGDAIESGAHTNSMRMVLEGLADVAAIDSTAFDQILRGQPELFNQVRVVESLGPNPVPPWIVSRFLADGERDALKEVLLGMCNHPRGRAILSNGLFEQFKPVEDADYDPIRRIVAGLF